MLEDNFLKLLPQQEAWVYRKHQDLRTRELVYRVDFQSRFPPTTYNTTYKVRRRGGGGGEAEGGRLWELICQFRVRQAGRAAVKLKLELEGVCLRHALPSVSCS